MAGLAATQRFGISAAQLATFTMLQLLVYAALQIPVGPLVDLVRAPQHPDHRRGGVDAGPVGFAFADTYALALIARLFVGMGAR